MLPNDGHDSPPSRDVERVLVRASRYPPFAPMRCVDVRPGGFATFDGDRIYLALLVAVGDNRTRVGWADRSALEVAVASALCDSATGVVRFGDQCAIRMTLGTTRAGIVERRLARIAADRAAMLVTWTSAAGGIGDDRQYDLVVDGTGPRVG